VIDQMVILKATSLMDIYMTCVITHLI